MNIEKIALFSMKNFLKEDIKLLETKHSSFTLPFSVAVYEFGLFIALGDTTEEETKQEKETLKTVGYSEIFIEFITSCKRMKYYFINIDQHGPRGNFEKTFWEILKESIWRKNNNAKKD